LESAGLKCRLWARVPHERLAFATQSAEFVARAYMPERSLQCRSDGLVIDSRTADFGVPREQQMREACPASSRVYCVPVHAQQQHVRRPLLTISYRRSAKSGSGRPVRSDQYRAPAVAGRPTSDIYNCIPKPPSSAGSTRVATAVARARSVMKSTLTSGGGRFDQAREPDSRSRRATIPCKVAVGQSPWRSGWRCWGPAASSVSWAASRPRPRSSPRPLRRATRPEPSPSRRMITRA